MAQGFIKGLRLGRTSEMRLVCADVAVSRCGTFSKVVDIISISENPRTFVTYIYGINNQPNYSNSTIINNYF